ncbi:MAG: ketoacyl-ACP synthase III [Proteobacteria bacterium]|nr:ketoacyl-ACP synthase III [Pseudomonadota bacterium]MBU1650511.1 ketoacyl-ACP synthase III [Pseudomonadota bacterium]
MIGIGAIASYLPEKSRDNFKLAAHFGEDETFVRQRLGGISLPVLDHGLETSDMAVLAIERLLDKTGLDKDAIQCLVVCTQNPDGRGLPHTAAIVQQKANLPQHTAAFDVSLGCSGYVYGLNIVKGFMENAGLTTGVFVTADPYSKIVDPEDRNTVMLFGDAAAATLLTVDNPIYHLGKSVYGTDGQGANHLANKGGRLHMNGRQVFNFAATQVPASITALLHADGITLEDVDQFIIHQGSRYIVETLSRRMGLDESKVPMRMEMTGNTVSSSIPLILQESINEKAIHKILIAGFGVGWSWGAMMLSRIKK